ncbi:MAG: hypothetical protein FWD31_04935 [Planctomycetaceae bacterium]|nr:hypothetical protein [Planctomycetaceae bacterium]
MREAELDPKVTGDLNYPGPGQTVPMQAAFWTDVVIDVENAEGNSLCLEQVFNHQWQPRTERSAVTGLHGSVWFSRKNPVASLRCTPGCHCKFLFFFQLKTCA